MSLLLTILNSFEWVKRRTLEGFQHARLMAIRGTRYVVVQTISFAIDVLVLSQTMQYVLPIYALCCIVTRGFLL